MVTLSTIFRDVLGYLFRKGKKIALKEKILTMYLGVIYALLLMNVVDMVRNSQ